MSNDEWNVAPQIPSFDTQDVDASKVGSLVIVDQPGKYHFQITSAVEKWETVNPNTGRDARPHIRLTCHVVHSTPGQSPAGTVYFHRLNFGGKGGGPVEDWARNASLNFLVGVGIIKEVKKDGNTYFIDPETNSTAINVPTLAGRLKNLQFIGKIEENKQDGYDTTYELRFGQGAFQVTDPRVANVPKNLSMIPGAGVAPPQPATPAPTQAAPASPPFDPTPQPAPAQQPQPAPQPAASAWDMSKI